MSQRSLGGYKFSSLVGKGGTAKRSAALAAKMKADMAARRALFSSNRLSGTTQQAIRTGGWANPSRGGELKYIDITANPVIAFNDGTMVDTPILLNGCIQGSDATNRIGRKIVMKSLLLRGTFSLAATSTGGSPIRIILFYDKQANASTPLTTDLLLADQFNSPNNLNNRDRFVILHDFMSEPISTGGHYSCSFKFYKKLNLETMFNSGNAGTVGDITSGALWLFVGQNGSIGTANPTLVLRTRVRFLDA